MSLNQPRPIQMERHLGIHRLYRPLLLERNRRLEHVLLSQIDLDPVRRRRSEHVAGLGGGFGEEFGHAVELGFDAVEAFGDGDGVVWRKDLESAVIKSLGGKVWLRRPQLVAKDVLCSQEKVSRAEFRA